MKLIQVQLHLGERFFVLRTVDESIAVRIINTGAAPKIETIFKTDAVCMADEGSKETRIRSVDFIYPDCGIEPAGFSRSTTGCRFIRNRTMFSRAIS